MAPEVSPVVFLDIDGVLNTKEDYKVWRKTVRGKVFTQEHDRLLINPSCVDDVLNTITQAAKADIVISSS